MSVADIIKCSCGAEAKPSERAGWVFDWKHGWKCASCAPAAAAQLARKAAKQRAADGLARSMANHPSVRGQSEAETPKT